MATKRKQAEIVDMEMYKLVLINVSDQPDISRLMSELGYPPEKMKEGEAHFNRSVEALAECSRKREELRKARYSFNRAWKRLKETYSIHRALAKVAFRKDETAIDQLDLNIVKPERYLPLMEMIRNFYAKILKEERYAETMAGFGLHAKDLRQALKRHSDVMDRRATYFLKRGESQNATEVKNATLTETDEWMRDFFAVARIATRKQPQLMEAFGKVVKS